MLYSLSATQKTPRQFFEKQNFEKMWRHTTLVPRFRTHESLLQTHLVDLIEYDAENFMGEM